MLGAFIGDTAGSLYEFNNIKTTDFFFFKSSSNYTDDSTMTMAVADWLLRDPNHSLEELENSLVTFGHKYPCPIGGYGSHFSAWLFSSSSLQETNIPTSLKDKFVGFINKKNTNETKRVQKRQPYNSWGNGSAMRVSAVGWMFDTLEETERVAKISAEITHNHPEGIKGAQATAAAIFLARTGKNKEEIKSYIEQTYGYNLSQTCDEIRPTYTFDVSCQGTVPQAIIAFLESTDFESAIRLAVSLGGDSDTLACICGGIAEAFYKNIPERIAKAMLNRLTPDFLEILKTFSQKSFYKPTYDLESYKTPQVRISPQKITELKENEIFVFGSNLAGQHGAGAARFAVEKFGAIRGQGVGLQGQSYAIPTMQGGVETIKPYVDEFIVFAKAHKELKFFVTPIGCGIAGFKNREIAPLFAEAVSVENIYLPKSFLANLLLEVD